MKGEERKGMQKTGGPKIAGSGEHKRKEKQISEKIDEKCPEEKRQNYST